MPEIPRTKFNSPWTVAVIEAALNDVSSAKGSSESLTAALNAMRAEINSLSGGVHLKGAVDYYNNLPATTSEGDAYTVRYQGTSGTDPLGIEYAWATYQGTPQWIPIGVDPSVFAKQSEINVVANAGAKNFAAPFNPISTTDITVTQNADGSYTFECADVSENRVIRVANIGDLPSGAYTFSGTTGGSSSTYMLGLYNTSASAVKYQHTNAKETYTGNVSGFSLRVRVISGYSGKFTVYPMLSPAAITDSTFQPYARTNRELTVLTDEDRAALVEIVDSGAKNLLKMGFTTKTVGTQTATMTADGNGITVNGDRNTSSDVILVYDLSTNESSMSDTRYTLPSGKYVITPTGTSMLRIQVYCHDGGGVNSERLGQASTDAVEFEYTAALKEQYPYIAYRLWAAKVSSFTNYTFYPMICTSSAWKISKAYQQYRPSWQEMWEAIQALQSGGNRALTMQTEPEEQEER